MIAAAIKYRRRRFINFYFFNPFPKLYQALRKGAVKDYFAVFVSFNRYVIMFKGLSRWAGFPSLFWKFFPPVLCKRLSLL